MTQPPPFDEWKSTMDDYGERIDVLAPRVPMPGKGPSPLFTKQRASLRDRHAEILDLVKRSQLGPDHMKSQRPEIVERLEHLRRDIDQLESHGSRD